MSADYAIYDDIVNQAAADTGAPASWIKAVIGTESSFQYPVARRWEPKAGEYSYGPMQILLSTARDYGFNGSGAELELPENNIPVGAAYLADLEGHYGSFERVYSAYNSGGPDNYQSSSEVGAHVAAALEWLKKFDTVGAGGAAAIVAIGAAAWWFVRRRKRKR